MNSCDWCDNTGCAICSRKKIKELENKITKQSVMIDNLAMFVSRLTASRQVTMDARKYLLKEGLIKSPLR